MFCCSLGPVWVSHTGLITVALGDVLPSLVFHSASYSFLIPTVIASYGIGLVLIRGACVSQASATALEAQASMAQQQEEHQAGRAALDQQLAAAQAELEQQAATFKDQLAGVQLRLQAAQEMASQSEGELCKRLADYQAVTDGLQQELKDSQAQADQLQQQVQELTSLIAEKAEAAAENAEALQVYCSLFMLAAGVC